MNSNYILLNKTTFFPRQEILAVGDLHLGYEHMLLKQGISLPENQIEEIKRNLEETFLELKEKKYSLKKIIFLGDIKHFFGYELKEDYYFRELMEFLKKYFRKENIILIKGNHDKFDLDGKKTEEYYFENGILFLHGHRDFLKIYEKEVETIVMGHLHPSVILSDKQKVKREKFKCFLIGKFKGKKAIILPSFFDIIEGTSVNDYNYDYQSNSIIPQKTIKNFEVFIIGNEKVYNFGKVKDLK